MDAVTSALVSYGGLGILALLSVLANIAQNKRITDLTNRFIELSTLRAKSDAELAAALDGLATIVKERRP